MYVYGKSNGLLEYVFPIKTNFLYSGQIKNQNRLNSYIFSKSFLRAIFWTINCPYSS